MSTYNISKSVFIIDAIFSLQMIWRTTYNKKFDDSTTDEISDCMCDQV